MAPIVHETPSPMTKDVDILVRNARLRDKPGELTDLAIAGGCIAGIGKLADCKGRIEIDAALNELWPEQTGSSGEQCEAKIKYERSLVRMKIVRQPAEQRARHGPLRERFLQF